MAKDEIIPRQQLLYALVEVLVGISDRTAEYIVIVFYFVKKKFSLFLCARENSFSATNKIYRLVRYDDRAIQEREINNRCRLHVIINYYFACLFRI